MLSAEPKAEADNTYQDLDYLGYLIIVLLYIDLKKITTHTVARNLNRYWKSCIARATYKLVNCLPADN